MSVTLSSADLAALTRTIQLLVTPLDHESADAWRSAVTREVKQLLNADSGGFLLAGVDGPLFYTDDFPQELIEGSELQPPALSDGTDIVDRGLELGVGKLELAYGPEVERYYRSDYYNDYADHLRKHDTLFTMAAIDGIPAPGVASLQLFHEKRTGRRFGPREIALLRLLFPAFRAGAEMCVRWERHRSDLARVLDTLGEAAVLFDMARRELHRTPGFQKAVEEDAESHRIVGAVDELAEALRRAALLDRSSLASQELQPVELRTTAARYALRGCLYGGNSGAPALLVTLQRKSPTARSSQELRAEYGLTPAEVRVAFVLARGWSNAEIAADLAISPHTARRHTERVLHKLSVRSRAEVAPKLFE
jgi:DNA-binding NarL/FixJ family response regulator